MEEILIKVRSRYKLHITYFGLCFDLNITITKIKMMTNTSNSVTPPHIISINIIILSTNPLESSGAGTGTNTCKLSSPIPPAVVPLTDIEYSALESNPSTTALFKSAETVTDPLCRFVSVTTLV